MTARSGPMVRLEQIVVRLGGKAVLDGTSLSISPGSLTMLVGASGCGKTTLLRLIAGLITCQVGRVERHFERAGMVFQEHRLLPWRTARENVAVGALQSEPSPTARRALSEELLATCGLAAEDFGKYPQQLSGGMRARVAIARALAAEPTLLLLDEPFNGLDVARRLAMQTLIRRLVDDRGITAVFVTHDLAEAARIADTVLVMAPRGGRIVHKTDLARSVEERDPGFVQAEIARLQTLPAISAALEDVGLSF